MKKYLVKAFDVIVSTGIASYTVRFKIDRLSEVNLRIGDESYHEV